MAEFDDKHTDCVLTRAECQRIFENMMLSLDGSLSENQEKDLMNEINKYPCCLEKFEVAQSFKQFLCSKIQRKHVPPSTIAVIKDKVHQIAVQQRV